MIFITLTIAAFIGSSLACFCENQKKLQPLQDVVSVETYEGMFVTLNCCSKELLQNIPFEFNDETDTIHWSYNGVDYPWDVEDRFDLECYPQQLLLKNPEPRDAGDYTCTYNIRGYGTVQRISRLTVYGFKPSPPVILTNSTSEILARRKENIEINCAAFVGGSSGSIKWHRQIQNKNFIIGENYDEENYWMSSLRVINHYQKGNKIVSSLIIKSLSKHHLGDYSCQATKSNFLEEGSATTATLNFTIVEGVSELTSKKEIYRAVSLSLTFGMIIFVILFSVTYFYRLGIALTLRQLLPDRPSAKHAQDLFILHGEFSGSWVWGKLVPTLEGKFNYSCFLPSRDLMGGEGLVDSLAQEVHSSRRILVVVTPCLLQCPWSLWCLEQAFTGVLAKELKIVAILRQDIKSSVKSREATRLLELLKYMSTITYLSKDLVNCSTNPEINYPLQQEKNHENKSNLYETNQLKPTSLARLSNHLELPKAKSDSCFFAENRQPEDQHKNKSNSLRNQRIENMISSTKDLATAPKAGEENPGSASSTGHKPITFQISVSSDDLPDTPSSITPFFPSEKSSNVNYQKDRTNYDVTKSDLLTKLKNFLVLDDEKKFWQRLLRELPVTPLSKMRRRSESEVV